MSRRWLCLLHCLLVCLCAVPFAAVTATNPQPPAAIRVDEASTRIALADKWCKASLAVENTSDRPASARVTFELLDPKDKLVSTARADVVLKRGASRVEGVLALPDFSRGGSAARRELLLYRLRYRVAPDPRASSFNEEAGVVSLSQIARDLFELRVATSNRVREGQLLHVRARALHPLTERAARGVRVEGGVSYEDAEDETRRIKARGETDSEGYVSLDFQLPPAIPDDEIDLEITGRLGDFVQSAYDDIDLDRRVRVLVSTDKPLYQPGQTVHLRALVVTNADRALSAAAGKLEIEDPEGTTVFDAALKTSRFGVASAEWKLADNTRLGDYSIKFELDDSDYDGAAGRASVKISRYELPNFSVAAKPDRDYYLRGQSAEVEVRADYLFGQPVRRGHVRVVRETERRWDYRGQKYETEEGERYEGELDGAGRFVARVDLSKAHEELAGSGWRRFEDLTFAAYVTDATTNRTEQRRFRLRATRDAIHVYVTEANTRQARGLPLEFYVATSYADGSPAQCEVLIEEKPREGALSAGALSAQPHRLLSKIVKTNRLGVAKVSGPVVPRGEGGERGLSFRFTARDREGRTGAHDDGFWMYGDPVIRVETDKSIYRAGEPIEAEIVSDQADLKVVVEVVSEGRTLHAEAVRLARGRASLTLPYRPEFRNRVTVAAYTAAIPEDAYGRNFIKGTRGVIYPRDRELKLDVTFGSASYRPGEEARASLRVKTAGGRDAESALGVVVFDKAVEERTRTEQEFSSSYGFYDQFRSFWYGDDSVAGLTLRDLERLDPAKTVSRDLDLAAELLLQRDNDYEPNFFGGADYETDQARVFADLAASELKEARRALAATYEKSGAYPRDEETLRRLLSEAGVAPSLVRDPWGTPYRGAFSIEQGYDVVEFASAGADKLFGTADDWKAGRIQFPYFRPHGDLLSRAVDDYHRRTGGYIRDARTLEQEARRAGLDLESLRDRWGKPYEVRFGIYGTSYTISVVSGGADGRVVRQTGGDYSADDFPVWSVWLDYFSETRQRIDAALQAFSRETGGFPKDERALAEVLRRVGVRFAELRDAWDRPFYATFRTETRYADRAQTEQRGDAGSRTQLTPVTRKLNFVAIRSAGADGRVDTADDFNAAEFSSVESEQSARGPEPRAVTRLTVFASGAGALGGTVTDPNGAAVPNATVTATHQYLPDKTFTTTTDEEGAYLLRNLPAGLYTLRADASGLKSAVVMGVAVHSESQSQVDLRLEVGSVSETVEVTAGAQMVNMTSAMTNATTTKQGISFGNKAPVATPRLRKDFPETLYWQPELITDRKGRSEIKFKLADNITTWKMSVIGSTEKGEIGTVEKEFRAFQPFFVELDPPPVLTEGDEIDLPVVVRNYLDTRQRVALDLKPESWFSLTGAAARETQVAAGDASRETFSLRAVASVKDGKQQVTARGDEAADAVEKSVAVHPDGQERADTRTQLFGREGAVAFDVPAAAIPGSLRAELKIYPNLFAHVVEGVEGIMKRPYGCAEQTISSTYPSLFVLRHYKQSGAADSQLPPVAAKAREYLRQGYERLLSYHAPDGGFTYWGRGESNVALTAYALRFLEDARGLTETDDSVLDSARAWLLRQQLADGGWTAYRPTDPTTAHGEPLLTSFAARVLARGERRQSEKSAGAANVANVANAASVTGATNASAGQPSAQTPPRPAATPSPFQRALSYLARRADELEEPYAISSYALALIDSGGPPSQIDALTRRLRALARDEGEGSYWALETNTPFHGWGLAGRIETTALAVSALARAHAPGVGGQESGKTGDETFHSTSSPSPSEESLVGRGLLFLLKNKDRYGVWHSTQATVNVLDALLNLSPAQGAAGDAPNVAAAPRPAQAEARASNTQTSNTQTAEVFVNGRSAGTLMLPSDTTLAAPVAIDLSRFVAAGANRVEVRRAGAGASARAAAQVVASYYVPWSDSSADGTLSSPRSSRALRLAVAFDRTSAGVGDEVVCRVEAERVGHRGYGMLLAEIGLPPGADVDRASLARAMESSGWDFSHYDLLPDRLVVYLWARPGGSKFEFTFRPRFGLRAKSAPSQVYDYYNPEARAELAPTSFVVAEKGAHAVARR
ncbi:MAG TPA: MG2 domain-containing protein [Pyrinomonadaceae bacterium]|jgi:hypothetical protein|nr:MG2 domain-containing protein [Pyrinomonadaceae bacterium]